MGKISMIMTTYCQLPGSLLYQGFTVYLYLILTLHSKVLSISKHLPCESCPLFCDLSKFTASIEGIELW